MPVDPHVQFLLEQATAQGQSSPREPMALLAELRAGTSPEAVKQALKALGSKPVPVAHVEDRVLPLAPNTNFPTYWKIVTPPPAGWPLTPHSSRAIPDESPLAEIAEAAILPPSSRS